MQQPSEAASGLARGDAAEGTAGQRSFADMYFERLGLTAWAAELLPFIKALALALWTLPSARVPVLMDEHFEVSWERRLATAAVVRRRDGPALARVLRVMREDVAGVRAVMEEMEEARHQVRRLRGATECL